MRTSSFLHHLFSILIGAFGWILGWTLGALSYTTLIPPFTLFGFDGLDVTRIICACFGLAILSELFRKRLRG